MSIGTRVTNALNCCWAFNLFDDAIADVLCLKTFQHGTSPGNYDNILKTGALVKYSGEGGEMVCQRKFGTTAGDKGKGFYVWNHNINYAFRALQTRVLAIEASIAHYYDEKGNIFSKIATIFKSIFIGFCAPTLKFRFRPDQIVIDGNDPKKIEFIIDTSYDGASDGFALYTYNDLPPEHLGLTGSIRQGFNMNWGERIKQDPGQFKKGLFKLVISLSMMALFCIAILHATRTLHWVNYNENVLKITLIAYGSFKGAQVIARLVVPPFAKRIQARD